jgi:Uma2 family endonuclease
MSTKVEETLEDLLHQIDQKAEIVNHQIILLPPMGALPGHACLEVFASLWEYSMQKKNGLAFGDNTAFMVNLPHRKSFSPCAGFFVGPYPKGFEFFQGAPVFAVEVRNEWDYGLRAEHERAAKRIDYFAAGTLVVWDVDLLSDDLVRVYRAGEKESTIYRRGQVAEAEPAVPGWTMPVDDFFPKRYKIDS